MLQKGRLEEARKSLKDLIDSELLQTIDNNVRICHMTLPFKKKNAAILVFEGDKLSVRLTLNILNIVFSTNPQ